MTLPSSGTLSFNSIRAEYAGPSSNVRISDYYGGGPVGVPYGYYNSNLVNSGQISVSSFYGTQDFQIRLAFTTGPSGGKAGTMGISPTQGSWQTVGMSANAPTLYNNSPLKMGNTILRSWTTIREWNYYENSPCTAGQNPSIANMMRNTPGNSGKRVNCIPQGGPSNTIQNQIHYGDGGNPNGTVTESEPGPGKGKLYRNHRASSPGYGGGVGGNASILSNFAYAIIYQQYNTPTSDNRLKENIAYIGDYKDYKVYTWDYNQTAKDLNLNDGPEVGVMAQEVLEKNPDAVIKDKTGYYRVNYKKL
jgi:hypothetical protein|tara:strand:- start:330 stop:1244 length:915 start_codon:yes stop_codon:yes gene_type:complete